MCGCKEGEEEEEAARSTVVPEFSHATRPSATPTGDRPLNSDLRLTPEMPQIHPNSQDANTTLAFPCWSSSVPSPSPLLSLRAFLQRRPAGIGVLKVLLTKLWEKEEEEKEEEVLVVRERRRAPQSPRSLVPSGAGIEGRRGEPWRVRLGREARNKSGTTHGLIAKPLPCLAKPSHASSAVGKGRQGSSLQPSVGFATHGWGSLPGAHESLFSLMRGPEALQ
ncbi:hypothetical protein O3P69_007055 [Scylla paramamosain]|uniref:Uncharacterized protein n=1 Tax=Scylla paramamosain TaxID=85552 RepID=A0AAW0V149_SCYPA